MLLSADPDSAFIDPFMDETTLVITCDVVDPTDGKGYDRDPRSIAKRAEAYLKASGIGDTAYFGPEPEFFIFDSGELASRYVRLLLQGLIPKRQLGLQRKNSRAATPATVLP